MDWFFGQFHPLFVHLPIGFWTLAFLFKGLSIKSQENKYAQVLPVLLLATFISSFFTSVTGYLLSLSGAYEIDLLDNHMWAGISLSVIAGLLYWFQKTMRFKKVQLTLWFLATIVLFVTGHLGGSLTHGEDYLTLNGGAYEKPVIENVQEALVYTDLIEPFFAEKCWACHSAKKQKGELRLDGEKWILEGGENGNILKAHQSQESELYARLILDKADEDHMPPSRKPQLTSGEITLIEWWISEGADFSKKVEELNQSSEIKEVLNRLMEKKGPSELPTEPIQMMDEQALKTLRDYRVAVVTVAQNSNYLAINLVGKSIPDFVWAALEKANMHIVSLKAKGSKLTDKQWQSLSQFQNLRTLDISQTNILDEHLIQLNKLIELRVLNLTETQISSGSIEKLASLEKLRNLYLFGTRLNNDDQKNLQTLFPLTEIDFGYKEPIMIREK
ncbi:MAG: hypothetical protein ACI9K1_002008 [Arcticibacterium sp.]|jgi:hypothetical protein